MSEKIIALVDGSIYSESVCHHAAWIARRWHDPAFPRAFPWFADDRHWEGVIQQLREQAAELQEPPLALGW